MSALRPQAVFGAGTCPGLIAVSAEQVLKQCGDNLTRENIMKQAANLKDFRVGLLLPNSRINTSPTDYRVVTYMQLQRFNGTSWDDVR